MTSPMTEEGRALTWLIDNADSIINDLRTADDNPDGPAPPTKDDGHE